MPTSADRTLLLDTSAAIAVVLEDHDRHVAVTEALREARLGLAGNAHFETYSVLTRLPPPHRVSAATAALVIGQNFPAGVFVRHNASGKALLEIAGAGISGGAVYDALVGLAARQAGFPLVTCDRRASETYLRLSVEFDLVA